MDVVRAGAVGAVFGREFADAVNINQVAAVRAFLRGIFLREFFQAAIAEVQRARLRFVIVRDGQAMLG